jgi:hypothetical protein
MPEPILMKPGMRTMPHEALSTAYLINTSLRVVPKIATSLILDVDTINFILPKHSLYGYDTPYVSLMDLF